MMINDFAFLLTMYLECPGVLEGGGRHVGVGRPARQRGVEVVHVGHEGDATDAGVAIVTGLTTITSCDCDKH